MSEDTFRISPGLEADTAQSAGTIMQDQEHTPGLTSNLSAQTPVRMPDGSVQYLGPDELIAAVTHGGEVLSTKEEGAHQLTEEYKQKLLDSPILGRLSTAGLGAIKDLPFGGTALRYALDKTGLMTPDQLAAANEAAGEVYPGSEFAGSVAPWLVSAALTGGAAPAAEAAAGGLAEKGILGAGTAAAREAGWLAAPYAFAGGAAEAAGKKILPGMLGRAAGTLGREAGEGFAVGAMTTANEDAIANHDLVAENLLQGGLAGAVFQTALGVPLGLARRGIRGFEPAPGRTQAELMGPEFADRERVFKATGTKPIKEMVDAPFAESDRIGSLVDKAEAVTENLQGADAAEDVRRALGKKNADLRYQANNAERILKRGDEQLDHLNDLMAKEIPDLQEEIHNPVKREARLRKMAEESNIDFDTIDKEYGKRLGEAAQLVEDIRGVKNPQTGEWVKQPAVSPELQSAANRLSKVIDIQMDKERLAKYVKDRSSGDALMRLEELRRASDDITQMVAKAKPNTPLGMEAPDFFKQTQELANGIRSSMRDESVVGKNVAQYIGESNPAESAFINKESELVGLGLMKPAEGTDWYKTFRKLNSDRASQIIRESADFHGEKKMNAVVDYLSSIVNMAKVEAKHSPNMPHIAERMQRVQDIRDAMIHILADMHSTVEAKSVVGRVAGKGSLGPFETLARGAGTLGGTAVGATLGLPGVGGAVGYLSSAALGSGNPAKLIQMLTQAENVYRARQKAVQKAIDGTLAGKSGKVNGINTRDFETIAQKFARMKADPASSQKALQAVIGDMGAHLPRITAAMSAKLLAATNHFADTLPTQKSSTNLLQPQFDRARNPSTLAQRQMARRLEAYFYPENVVWNPSREGVDTLKQLHPETFQQMQNYYMEAVAKSNKRIPFSVRQKMALMLDLPTDAIQDPTRWAEFQEKLNSAGKTQKPPARSGKPVKTASDLVPMTDNIESGGSYERQRA